MRLEITPLEGEPLGAMVTGWEPEEHLDAETRNQIRDALAEHVALVFRGHQQPSDEALVDFAEGFGPLIKGSEWFRVAGDRPEILPVTNAVGEGGIPVGAGAAASLEWHADYSYVPEPGKESFLNAVELPADPPRTYFCSQYRALETLPEELVERLRSLSARHSVTGDAVGDVASDSEELRDEFRERKRRDAKAGIERPRIPDAEHPVVVRHPDTGREVLYVSKGLTKGILGIPKEESSALLKELHEHSTRPENVYAHDWQVGDMVVFDTYGALHKRDSWDKNEVRVMRQLSTHL